MCSPGRAALTLLVGSALLACREPVDLDLPTADEIMAYYESDSPLGAELRGNVAVLRVQQSPQQLRRGGTLWAKVGPYVYLFTEESRQLMADYGGLAGVRIETHTPGGTKVATALLARDALTDVLWRRSFNISGRARRDGTERITLLEDLIDWGERHADFEYNPQYTRRR